MLNMSWLNEFEVGDLMRKSLLLYNPCTHELGHLPSSPAQEQNNFTLRFVVAH